MEASIIRLDVGGTPYATSLETLCRYPESMLARMFTGELPNRRTPDGSYFIDRDGLSFRKVLNFLRTAKVHATSEAERRELLREAEYFQLPEMSDKLRGLLPRRKSIVLDGTFTTTHVDRHYRRLELKETVQLQGYMAA